MQTSLESYYPIFDREGVGSLTIPARELNLLYPFRGLWIRADTRTGTSIIVGYLLDGVSPEWLRLSP